MLRAPLSSENMPIKLRLSMLSDEEKISSVADVSTIATHSSLYCDSQVHLLNMNAGFSFVLSAALACSMMCCGVLHDM